MLSRRQGSNRVQRRTSYPRLAKKSPRVPAVAVADGVVDLTCVADETFIDLTMNVTSESPDLTSPSESPILIADTPISVDDHTGSRRHRQDDQSPSTSQRPGTSLNAMEDGTSLNAMGDGSDSDSDSSLPPCIFTPPTGRRVVTAGGPSTRPVACPAAAAGRDNELVPGVVSCPVCLETLPQIKLNGGHLVSTTCGHIFCHDCITNIFCHQTQKTHKCPTCRKLISRRTVHQLFI